MQISRAASLGAVLAPYTGRVVHRIGLRALLTLSSVKVVVSCLHLVSVQTKLGFYVAFTFARTADQGLIKIGATPAMGR